MQIIADLHLHSKYSRAVSPEMRLPVMSLWGQKKGLDLLATGDWTHPLWLKELETELEEDGEGIFKVKGKEDKTRFILSGEISNIYSQNNQGRRVHTLFFSPSFETVHKINAEITRRGGNLLSDGRPILGLSLQDLCELVWTIDEKVMMVPAHIWTPWFSVFGSKSGFDSLQEAFGQYAQRIYSVETGLSSDPLMNWKITDLETRSIVSNSDSHSPRKMGREATVLELEKANYSFNDISEALKRNTKTKNKIAYTIEFHPEEGKYHYTGHRACGVVQSPEETARLGTTCHVCGKSLTVGVEHRVEELSHRGIPNFQFSIFKAIEKSNEHGVKGYFHPTDKTRPPYVMLVPLAEILAECLGVGVASKKVDALYEKMLVELGNELNILLKTDLEKIRATAGDKVAEGVSRVRSGNMVVEPGYDGVFGVVKIWGSPTKKNDATVKSNQQSLF